MGTVWIELIYPKFVKIVSSHVKDLSNALYLNLEKSVKTFWVLFFSRKLQIIKKIKRKKEFAGFYHKPNWILNGWNEAGSHKYCYDISKLDRGYILLNFYWIKNENYKKLQLPNSTHNPFLITNYKTQHIFAKANENYYYHRNLKKPTKSLKIMK